MMRQQCRRIVRLNEKTDRNRLRLCTRVVAKFQQVLNSYGELFFNSHVTDSFADSGRQSAQEILYL
jgi:hypothetical protein